MTCCTSALHWIDVLYNSVRRTSGGVADAAAFLADRRGPPFMQEAMGGQAGSGGQRPSGKALRRALRSAGTRGGL